MCGATHCYWVCKMGQRLWKTFWQFLQKVKHVPTYNSEIAFWTFIAEKCKLTFTQKSASKYLIFNIFNYLKAETT